MSKTSKSITIAGAGVIGLWQALMLAKRGHSVQVFDRVTDPLSTSASALAGTMLAPDCEFQRIHQAHGSLSRPGIELWQRHVGGVIQNGTLIVAKDVRELEDFARQTETFRHVGSEDIRALEPALAGRFQNGLYFPDEAHMVTPDALQNLAKAAQDAGAELRFGETEDAAHPQSNSDWLIHCTGIAAQLGLPDLRGVRGERIIVRCPGLSLKRPVRLLHLRQPIYIVPWDDGLFMIGATMIESEDSSGVTVKSALDLLAIAYQVQPEFGEAEIVTMGAALRPAFPDNLPKIIVKPSTRTIHVNGAYRHGFLVAPVLAQALAEYLESGAAHPWLTVGDDACARQKAE